MNAKDRDLLVEVKTILVGKEGTEVKGMAGDISDMEKHLRTLNGEVARNTAFRKNFYRIGIPIIVALITVGAKFIVG